MKEVLTKMDEHQEYMAVAIKEAKKALKKLEVPVGAIIVKDGEIIAKAYNLKETQNDATKHAEIIAIQKASKKLKRWRLLDCEMYVTLEPCPMCAGAILQSRIKKVYIGAMDEVAGSCGSIVNLTDGSYFDTRVELESGICEEECKKLLQEFFKDLRKYKR